MSLAQSYTVFPHYSGTAHEYLEVIGQHRNSKRYITIAIATKRLCNFRVQKVFRPSIVKKLDHNKSIDWSRVEAPLEILQKIADWANRL